MMNKKTSRVVRLRKMEVTVRIHVALPAMTGAIALALLVGCSSVTMEYPLSAQPKPVDKDKFEGTWLIDKGTVDVRFASNGVARIAAVEWKDEQFRLVQGEMIVAEGSNDNFISVRFKEDDAWTNCYYFFQYKFTDNDGLLLWLPNVDAFEAAIETNLLHGVVEKRSYSTSISVTNSPDDILAFMNDPERRDLFKYRDPMVLRRIAAPEKAEPSVGGDGKPAPQP